MIFLSHSWQDNERVAALGAQLRIRGAEVWLDGDQIRLSDAIPRAMNGGLSRAEWLVAAWSAAAAVSPHVANELDSFYMRFPEPGRMLFLRLDATPVPALYAARVYLVARTPDNDAEAIHRWISGNGTDLNTAPKTSMTADTLRLFPRGPMVPTRWIPQSLVLAYATRYGTRTASREVLDRAITMREEADPNDSSVTMVTHGDLPAIDMASPKEYWSQAFDLGALHGPRALAAIVLAEPDDLFDTRTRHERAELLLKLRLIT